MSKYLIRPHHMLCMQFFEGKGYSDGFVASMAAIKEKLEKHPNANNPYILPTSDRENLTKQRREEQKKRNSRHVRMKIL